MERPPSLAAMNHVRLPALTCARNEGTKEDWEKTRKNKANSRSQAIDAESTSRVSTPSPPQSVQLDSHEGQMDSVMAALRRVRIAPSLDPCQPPFHSGQVTVGADGPRSNLPPLHPRSMTFAVGVLKSGGESQCAADGDASPDSRHRSSSISACAHVVRRQRRLRTEPAKVFSAATPSTASSTPLRAPSSASSASSAIQALSAVSLQKEQSRQEVGCIRAWRCGAQIGQGSYGSVHKALELNTGMVFAVKRALIRDGDEGDRKYVEKLSDELNIFRSLRHPNIVSYLGHELKDGALYVFMEFVAGGSLSSIIHEFGPLEGQLLKSATLGMIMGLDYLHSRSPPVVHRDIKGANVLVDADFNIKLADFGSSKRCDVSTSFTTTGSIPWMAPEVIDNRKGYGRKADIWSLGCTIIELATAELPWGKGAFQNVVHAIKRIGLSDAIPPIPASMPPALQDLTASCVQRQPGERPTASQLLLCEFFLPSATPKSSSSSRSRHRPSYLA